MRHSIVLALFLSLAAFCRAQILPSRNLPAMPLADTGSVNGVMARSHFYGELARSFGSPDDNRAWDATIGGFADLYRWSGGGALRVRFAQEMLANDLNDIHFKPLGMLFEENISGVFRGNGFDWECGFSYRCKHDIDNTDNPVSSITPAIDSNPQKRVLILGGFFGNFSSDPIALSSALSLNLNARADYYLIHEDDRYPYNGDGMLWGNVRGSLELGGRLSLACSPDIAIYTFDWAAPMFAIGAGPGVNANAHAEAGMRLNGAVGGMDFFVAYEHLFDDLSVPEPRLSNTIALGLRVN